MQNVFIQTKSIANLFYELYRFHTIEVRKKNMLFHTSHSPTN
jgi:hypothetical protein